MSYWGFPRYVSVGEKQQKAKRKLEQLRKKNKNIRPVIIEGGTLAHTWWGKAWNKNLEGYADYSNRIGRGRSYVRCGSVLDLQLNEGIVQSLVQGSESKPYSIAIKIKPLGRSVWKNIKDICEGKLDSLQELLVGKFPKALSEIFTAHGKGLFPSPKEIDFECSCPDWASMCKHVAATLYGVGARMDEDPNLFFVLRKIKINDLITETIKDRTKKLLTKAKKKSTRIIDDQDLSSVFGIDIESGPASAKKAKTVRKDKTPKAKKHPIKAKKSPTKKPIKKASRKPDKKTPAKAIKKTTKKTAKTVAKPNKKTSTKAIKKTTKKPAKSTQKTVKKPVKKSAKKLSKIGNSSKS